MFKVIALNKKEVYFISEICARNTDGMAYRVNADQTATLGGYQAEI